MIIISLILFHFSFIYGIKSITECNDICHSFIREVLTLEMCRYVYFFYNFNSVELCLFFIFFFVN